VKVGDVVVSDVEFGEFTSLMFDETGQIVASNPSDLLQQILDLTKQFRAENQRLVDDMTVDDRHQVYRVMERTIAGQVLRCASISQNMWPISNSQPSSHNIETNANVEPNVFKTRIQKVSPESIDETFIHMAQLARPPSGLHDRVMMSDNLFELLGTKRPGTSMPYPGYRPPVDLRDQVLLNNYPVGSMLIAAELTHVVLTECSDFIPESNIKKLLAGRLGTWNGWGICSDVFRGSGVHLAPGEVFLFTRIRDPSLALSQGIADNILRHPGVIQEAVDGVHMLVTTPVGFGKVVVD
jgi:hypothetical protein